MRILFLGDIVGPSGCNVVKQYLPNIVNKKTIDFVVANGENAAENGVGITEKICNVHFKEGTLEIVYDLGGGNVYMTGPVSDIKKITLKI